MKAGKSTTEKGSSAPLLRLEEIGKSFGATKVLDGVTLSVAPGEVIGLLGENGAGKSTMMNIVAGALEPSTGRMDFANAPHRFASISEGIEAGIAFVHQELSVVGSLTVAENLFLGRMPRNRLGLVDFKAMHSAAGAMLAAVGASDIDPAQLAGSLRTGEQQLIEIARAAAQNPRLLILDEPTSSLTPHEVSAFLDYVRKARRAGISIIFITHRLDEAMTICDRLLVLRNGVIVSDRLPADTTKEQIIADMTGKASLFAYTPRTNPSDIVALRVRNLADRGHISGISLDVRQGEIFGLFGLVGAGRTEFLETIVGAKPKSSGNMQLFNQDHAPRTPAQALQTGVALVPEGRKTAGILPQHSVRRNASASSLRQSGGGVMVSTHREAERTAAELKALAVRMSDDRQPITTLSGGNQQKVVFARALLSGPRLLLLDEPTHGIDIGAKSEIYEIIRRAAENGLTVIVASSELPEIIALCDRVAVLSKGRLADIVERDDMDEAHLLQLAFSEYEKQQGPQTHI